MEIVQSYKLLFTADGIQAVEGAAKALNKTGQEADEAGKKLGKLTDKTVSAGKAFKDAADDHMKSFQDRLKGLASFVLPAGIAAGIAMVTKSAIDAADGLNDLKTKTGMSTETLSVLQHAAGQADTSLSAVASSVRVMSKNVEEAAKGNADLQAGFARVGISLEDLRHKDPQALFLAIANGVQKIQDPTERSAAAQQLLGRGAMELLPLMKDLAGDGFAKVSEEAKKLGLIIDGPTAEAADHFNDNLAKLQGMVKGSANTIMSALLPSLNGLTDTLADSAQNGLLKWLNPLGLIAKAIQGLVGIVQVMEASFRAMVAGAGAALDGLVSAWDRLKTGDVSGAWGAIKSAGAAGNAEVASIWADWEKKADKLFNGGGATAGPTATSRSVVSAADVAAGKEHAADAKKAAAERERELEALRGITQHHQELLAQTAAETDLQQKITKIITDRDKEVEKIARMSRLSVKERYDAEVEAQATAEALIADAQADSVKKFQTAMTSYGQELVARMEADQAADLATNLEAMSKRGIDLLARMKAEAERAALNFSSTVNGTLADAIADAGTTGGKNFASIVSGMVGSLIQAGAKDLMERVSMWAGGITKGKDGSYQVGGQSYATLEEAQLHGSWKGQALEAGAAAYGVGMNSYGQARTGQSGSMSAGILGGAMAGAATGNVYAVVALAIAGAVGAYLGKQENRKEYKYAIPGVNAEGEASLDLPGSVWNRPWPLRKRNLPNTIQDAEADQMIQQIQETYDSVRNAFVKVFLAFPGEIIPAMEAIDGKFQDNPSAHFMEHFQQWVTQTLPAEIAAQFESGMKKIFTGAGMAGAAFDKYLGAAASMDPKKAAEFWLNMAEGINAFNRARGNMGAVGDALTGQSGRYAFTPDGRLQGATESDFQANLRAGAAGLYDIARQMVNMTGADKVAAFKALGQGVEAVTHSLQAYIQQIGETLKGLAQTFADQRLAKAVDRETDPNKKAAIYQSQFDKNLVQIQHADTLGLSAAQVNDLTNRNVDLLNKIYDLDPSAAAYEWWTGAMSTLEQASTDSLNLLAQQARDQVQAVLDTLQPFEDWFLGLPVNLDPAWAALDSQINGAATALQELARVVRDSTPATGGGGGGGDTGGGGGGGDTGGDKGGGEDHKGNSVVVHVAAAYGIEDFQRQMTSAAAAAFRDNPSMYTRDF